ncbi:hypothetical protein CPB86DRAFT_257283 [Serendipita vermifera]|nr:hypothetical protein CPB86DRAFT_257283 [Serendipita vermifera]
MRFRTLKNPLPLDSSQEFHWQSQARATFFPYFFRQLPLSFPRYLSRQYCLQLPLDVSRSCRIWLELLPNPTWWWNFEINSDPVQACLLVQKSRHHHRRYHLGPLLDPTAPKRPLWQLPSICLPILPTARLLYSLEFSRPFSSGVSAPVEI